MRIIKSKVLFVCVKNSCRSQIAQGLANYLGKDLLEAYSAGSKPAGIINSTAIEVMKELGIDISKQKSKGFNELAQERFDYVITMGCKDICPFVPAEKHIPWQIPDPEGKDIAFFRKIRDEIKEKVINLIEIIAITKER